MSKIIIENAKLYQRGSWLWRQYTKIEDDTKTFVRETTGYRPDERIKAEQELEDLKRKHDDGHKVQMTVAEIIDEYWAEKELEVAASSLASDPSHIKKIKESPIANLRPDQITRKHCQEFSRDISAGTARKRLGKIRAAIRYVTGIDIVLWMPKPPEPRPYFLTIAEVDKLLDVCYNAYSSHIYYFALLAYTTGARGGDVRRLKWQDVLFDEGKSGYIIYRRPANGKPTAKVPLNNELRDELLTLKDKVKPRPTDHVIEFRGHGCVTNVQTAFESAVERAGLPEWVTPHVLRHTAVTHMREAGMSWEDIAEVVGHLSPATTKFVYSHAAPQTHAAVGALAVKRRASRSAPITDQEGQRSYVQNVRGQRS